jgi:Mn2+/Fe2+ NRAMP family transporter
MNFIGIDPVKALIYTAVINGIAAVPLLFLIIKIAASDAIMGEYKSGRLSKILLWMTFIIMGAAALGLIILI